MKRRHAILLAALGIMVTIAALGQQKPAPVTGLPGLDWARKSSAEAPPVAILVELGVKDAQPTTWNGKAVVAGAKVVHREGYRFRDQDKLIGGEGWEASSRRSIRLPAKQPALAAIEGINSVGVVIHLAEVQPKASVVIQAGEAGKATVAIKDVLSGKPQPILGGTGVVRLISTAVPVAAAKTEDDFPAAAYGPDGTLWLAYISYTVREEDRRIEAPQLPEQPKDFKSYYTPEFGDQVFVKCLRGGKWGDPVPVTEPSQDLVRCAVAVDGQGEAWVTYSANRGSVFSIYGRPISLSPSQKHPVLGPERRLTRHTAPDLGPVMCANSGGQLRLAFQCWAGSADNSHAGIGVLYGKEGEWGDRRADEPPVILNPARGDTPRNAWFPAVAAGPNFKTAVAHDVYQGGDYDVLVHDLDTMQEHRVATSAKFEARPSLSYDAKGRLWVAYEEGPEKWGKDFGALDDQDGNPLYFARTIKVVCLQDGKLLRPAAELPPLGKRGQSPDTGAKVEAMPRYSSPNLGVDGKGRVWLTYRQKFGTRYTSHAGSYWLTMARRLDGDRWSDPIEVHHSDGLLDSRPVLLPHPKGGLLIFHNTDGRYTTPETLDNQIYLSHLDLPGDPVEPKLLPHESGSKDPSVHGREDAALRQILTYRIEAGGKKYSLLRGEFHRHTEVSWDGGPDGSLEDMFRYGIDAAAMDWIGNGDHDNGAGREYVWWLTQKLTDAYHVPGKFTPMFTYERSVSYPHGHRNCLFARRGIRTLPRLAEPDVDKRVAGIHADDTKMLYRYLRELDGITAVHTSATSMGTDWRDNDPVVEPFVEIYQGDRMNYEKEGAPRAGTDPKLMQPIPNIAGWYPKGFVNLALEKGYRLGFQASSDHFSTHISYCIVLAERPDRAGLLDAMKKRHVYAATDNIVLDVRSGEAIMGDEIKAAGPPALQVRVLGTAPLARVEVLKDSEVVHTWEPKSAEFDGKWTDPKPAAGVHYYYVRVQQTDGEIAWGSPLWIDVRK